LNAFSKVYNVESVPLDAINPPVGWRKIIETNVDTLAQSMLQNGQLQPVGLIPAKDEGRYDLKWGEHRRLVARKLNWKNIDAVVIRGLSPTEADILTLEENLARNSYACVLEEAIARSRQKELYLQLHPETGPGGNRHQDKLSNPNSSDLIPPPYSVYVANASNESRDRIELLVKIGVKLAPYADLLFGTPLENNQADLLALCRYEGDILPLIELVRGGSVSTVADAKRAIAAAVKVSAQMPEEAGVATGTNEPGKEEMSAGETTSSNNVASTPNNGSTMEVRLKKIEERLDEVEDIPGYLAKTMEYGADEDSDFPDDLELWDFFMSAKELLRKMRAFNPREDFECPKCGSKHLVAVNIKCTNCDEKFWSGWAPSKEEGTTR
jgi:hypothetical protein